MDQLSSFRDYRYDSQNNDKSAQRILRTKFRIDLWKLFFITLLIFFQVPIFVIIVYKEPVLNIFFNMEAKASPGEIPNKILSASIYLVMWFSVATMVFAMIFLLYYVFSFKGLDAKYYQACVMFSVLGIIIISTILFTSAEIKYSIVIAWCTNIKQHYYASNPLINNYPHLINDFKRIASFNVISMHWVDYRNALWINGIEIVLISILFMNFQLKFVSHSSRDQQTIAKIENLYKKESFGETKEKQFLSKFLVPTPKNVSIFFIVVSLFVLLPSFIFMLRITVIKTSFSDIIYYSYIQPQFSHISESLASAQYYDFYNQVINQHTVNLVVLLYVPAIFLGLSISFAIVLIFFIFNEKIMSINFLLILCIILWFLVVASSIFIFISSYYLNHLLGFWNTNLKDTVKWSNFISWVSKNIGLVQGQIKAAWFNTNSSLSLFILKIAFFTSTSIIGINQIKNARKQKIINIVSITL